MCLIILEALWKGSTFSKFLAKRRNLLSVRGALSTESCVWLGRWVEIGHSSCSSESADFSGVE